MRHLCLLFMAVAVAACGGSPSPAPAPSPTPVPAPAPALGAGPVLGSDRLVFDSTRVSSNQEIFVMKTDGSEVQRLTQDTAYVNWWPRISPDRRKILFHRAPAGFHEKYDRASLWAMNTDGTALTQLRAQGEDGWAMQGHAEWSPDGTRIALFGSATVNGSPSLEIYVTDVNGKNPVQFTARGGVNTDVAWSPNSQQLLFNGCPVPSPCVAANYEIYIMNAQVGATPVRLTTDALADYDPYFSPDGTRIAWLVNVDPTANLHPTLGIPYGRWAIRIATIGQTPTYLIDDGNVNSKPSWSLDGQHIYFHRGVTPDFRFRLFRINTSGAPNLTELNPGSLGSSEYPAN